MLPYFYYLPKGVLCAMVSVVAYSLVEEAPHDVKFFLKIRGWSELILMGLIFFITIIWDLKRGIGVGIGLSILRLIRHSVRPRIQILGRVPGTTNQFSNAENHSGDVEFIEGCLIVKIPEPLTFANTGNLKTRLRRLEDHGTDKAHPALPRVRRAEHNKNIIFDVHGVTSLDGAGAQVLAEIVESYRSREVRVFFCRVPKESSPVYQLFDKSGIVEMCGGPRHFVQSVEEALRMTELERLTEEFASSAEGSRAASSRA
jgi:MFS superfamily sulfate permease-like transporter